MALLMILQGPSNDFTVRQLDMRQILVSKTVTELLTTQLRGSGSAKTVKLVVKMVKMVKPRSLSLGLQENSETVPCDLPVFHAQSRTARLSSPVRNERLKHLYFLPIVRSRIGNIVNKL